MSTICVDCGHRHRQNPQCLYCDCFSGVLQKEKTMLKKIWKIICWPVKIICKIIWWPFKKFFNWLASCLPINK
jgi:hypothetical protein